MEPEITEITCVADCYATGFDSISVASAVVLALVTKRWRYVPVAAAIAWFVGEVVMPGLALGFYEALRWSILSPPDSGERAVILYLTLLTTVAFVFGLKHTIISAATGRGTFGLRLYMGGAALVVAGLLGLVVLYAFAPGSLPASFRVTSPGLTDDLGPQCRAGSATPVAGLPRLAETARRRTGVRTVGPLSAEQLALPAVHTTEMLFQHRLGFSEHIRVSDPSRYGENSKVALTLAVNERGVVIAATPFGGPKELFGRAVAIASSWKFAPFVREGRPISVRILRTAVEIAGPERWWPLPLQYPNFESLGAVTIRLTRTEPEQALAVEVRGDGTVTFRGRGSRIAIHGTHCALIDRATVAALVGEFRRAHFFALLPDYSDPRANIRVSIAIGDFAHNVSVYDYDYGEDHAPEAFWRLVQSILDAVHAERWTNGDHFTGATLIAENWNFKATNQENAFMLAHVARGGDTRAFADLLALGAPLTPNEEPATSETIPGLTVPNFDAVRTVLEESAGAGAFDIVKIVLASPVQWPKDALSGAYVSAVEYGNNEVAKALLERGADWHAKGLRAKTALMAAATSGQPELVERELKRGADVMAGDENGFTPLHWAAGTDYLKTVDSVRSDRAKVIKLLLDAGAKVNVRAEYMRWTPLHSNWMGLSEVTSTLIANGADVNAQDEDGNTPLMLSKSVESVRLLLAAGANPFLRNNEGKNALDVARADIFGAETAREIGQWMAEHPERRR